MKKILLILIIISFCSCSSLTRKEKSVATGSVVGGTIGAIIGSQAGSAGAGLALGAMAGAGTGALIGHELQTQDEQIAKDQLLIQEQKRTISTQQREINELRNISKDSFSYKQGADLSDDFREKNISSTNQEVSAESNFAQNEISNSYEDVANYKVVEPSFDDQQGAPLASYDWKKNSNNIQENTQRMVETSECQDANLEATKAEETSEVAEKLYHYRRALRLCPDNAKFHNALGEIYLSLNRLDDAKFEFEEALKIDPNFESAKNNLTNLNLY